MDPGMVPNDYERYVVVIVVGFLLSDFQSIKTFSFFNRS